MAGGPRIWRWWVFCLLVMPAAGFAAAQPAAAGSRAPAHRCHCHRRHLIRLPANVLQALLAIAGLACCVAMSMPQVHIVAYCSDLGYGAGNGAEMLSLMLGCGIVSRIGSGFLADRLGGLATLLVGSFAQMVALTLYMMADGLTSLYVISALFGLFQGGLVPSYAIIVRESFPCAAGWRAGRCDPDDDDPRHGAGRLDVGGDLRPDRILSGGVRQWRRLERAELPDRGVAAVPFPAHRTPEGHSTTRRVWQQNNEVEQDGEVFHIIQVVAQLGPGIVDRGAIGVVDLRPAGQAGLHQVTLII